MEEGKGFRAELIERFDKEGRLFGETLLKALLANAYGGKDFGTLASALLVRFPSARCALDASYDELMTVEGMTSSVALYLKACAAARDRVRMDIDRIESSEQLVRFVSRRVGEFDYEHLEAYIVAKNGKVIRSFSLTTEALGAVDLDIRGFMDRLSANNAYGFYLVHNHLTSNAQPSPDDDETTFRMLKACRGRGIKFIDHCIVAHAGAWYSYRRAGRLD